MAKVSQTPAGEPFSINVAGFYHDPLIFLDVFPMVRNGTPEAFVDRFDTEVFSASLDCGLKISATAEGHFKFDFNAMPDSAYTATEGLDFNLIAEMRVRRAAQLEQLADRIQPVGGRPGFGPPGATHPIDQRPRPLALRRLPVLMKPSIEHIYCLSA
jgi:hypothetical protein